MENQENNYSINQAKELIIANGVTRIENEQFEDCRDFVRVILPKSLIEIGENAFKGCTELESVVFNEGLKTIEHSAFRSCCNLMAVKLPNSLEVIQGQAFNDCRNLETVEFGNNLRQIKKWAFLDCPKLKTVAFPKSLESIGEKAFADCEKLNHIVISDDVDIIDDMAFANCASLTDVRFEQLRWSPCALNVFENTPFLENRRKENPLVLINDHIVLDGRMCQGDVVLPEGIKQINHGAFTDCVALTSIKFPPTLQYIGYNAFMGCTKLKEVDLPDAIDFISDSVFMDCTSLETIRYKEKDMKVYGSSFVNTPWLAEKTKNNALFCSCGSLVDGRETKGKVVVENVKYIVDEAFYGNCEITEVEISEGVEEINYKAFANCLRLKKVTFPNTLKKISSEAFSNCRSLNNVTLPDGIEIVYPKTFKDCVSLEEIHLPTILKEVRWDAFKGCFNLKMPVLGANTVVDSSAFPPEGIEKYETIISEPVVLKNADCKDAYYHRYDLVDVVIPEGITSIGEWAFLNCYNLRSVTLPKSLKHISANAFRFCKNLQHINFPENLQEIGEGAFAFTNIKKVELPAGFCSLGQEAFSYSGVEEVVFLNGADYIYNRAFAQCKKLQTISIFGSVQHIGEEVFHECKRLTKLNSRGFAFNEDMLTGTPILNSVSASDSSPFLIVSDNLLRYMGSAEPNVVIPEGVCYIGPKAFIDHNEIVSVHLPDTLTEIGSYAFIGCSRLASVNFPPSLNRICEGAFIECGFESVEWPASVTEMDHRMFMNCRKLTAIKLPNTFKYVCLTSFEGCNLSNIVLPESTNFFIPGKRDYSEINTLRSITFADTITLLNDNYDFNKYVDNHYVVDELCETPKIFLWNGNIKKIKSNQLIYKLVNDFCNGLELGYGYSEKAITRNKVFIRQLYNKNERRLIKILSSVLVMLLSIINKILYIVFFPYYIYQYITHFSLKGTTVVPDLFLESTIRRINNWNSLYENFTNEMGEATIRYLMKEGLLEKDDAEAVKPTCSNKLQMEIDAYIQNRN